MTGPINMTPCVTLLFPPSLPTGTKLIEEEEGRHVLAEDVTGGVRSGDISCISASESPAAAS